MQEKIIPEYEGFLRKFMLKVPEEISKASGIRIFGKKIKSIVFSTDICIIRNCNADAVIAVYPFTPQPIISGAVISAADIPVFAGVGGGLTRGTRVLNLANHAEHQGALAVVVNSPTGNECIKELKANLDIPVILTVANDTDDIKLRLEAGADIFNVSAAAKTAAVVRKIRTEFPNAAIIATGGPTGASILETIEAGANAITWTPPSNGEVFRDIMHAYRLNQEHP